jgi:hypothetical protein
MTAQADLFATDEMSVRSFPPHLDPSRAVRFEINLDEDTDHVAPAVNGTLPVGAVGNNRDVWLAQVFDRADQLLASFPLPTHDLAMTKCREISDAWERNAQLTLL